MTDDYAEGEQNLPIITPKVVEEMWETSEEKPRDDAKVAGVLLAAGTSSRFGDTNKLLATVGGKPIIRHAADTLLTSCVTSSIAIVGHEAERIQKVLPEALSVAMNPDYKQGQATSVATAIKAIGDADAAIFMLGDMPRIQPETVDLLVNGFRAGFGDPLAAAYEGRRGNPVLFGARHFDALTDVTGDTGGRDLILESEDAVLVETNDPGVLEDVDTQDDLTEVQSKY